MLMAVRTSATKLAPGIYRERTGCRAFVRVPIGQGKSKLVSKRFPKNAMLTYQLGTAILAQKKQERQTGSRD